MDNKNYYELLEIDKNASQEIIDKAYKLLVKKYHPDLQKENNKEEYEKIIKKINEAYEVLSDKNKRKEYDDSLQQNYISKEEYIKLYDENKYLKQKLNNIINQVNITNSNANTNIQKNISYHNKINNQENIYKDYENKFNEAINKAYYDSYIQDLKNRGYKIKYKKSFKSYLISIFSILLTILIAILIFQIPFIKNYFINLYTENEIIKTIIDFISNFFYK